MAESTYSPNESALTTRQLEVLTFVAAGYSNREIAEQLVITVHTVKDHLKHIYSKLNVRRRTEAVSCAREMGLLQEQTPTFRTKLPVSLLPLIGRTSELKSLAAYFAQPDVRLITIHGIGGIGKTHLAIEVARQQIHLFANDVYFVGLETLDSPSFFLPILAKSIGFRSASPHNLQQQLIARLSKSEALLILDACENILDNIHSIGELLKGAPGLKILATSRLRLNIMGEVVFSLQGVPFPEDVTTVNPGQFDAIQLFLYNAERVLPGFQPTDDEMLCIAQICQYVDGLPLAILLAASWVNVLPVQDILIEMQRDVTFLETHELTTLFQSKSLLNIFSHSWELLKPHQRDVFIRLSLFRGRFSREAAQAVAGASVQTLNALVGRSILQWDTHHKLYYLHSMLRQYGLKRLDRLGKKEAVFQDYFDYWHSFVHTNSALTQAKAEKRVLDDLKDKHTWEHELEELRACLRWGIDNGKLEKTLEMALEMRYLWILYGFHQEQFDWFSSIFKHAKDINSELHATALYFAGGVGFLLGNYDSSRQFLEQSIAIAEELPVRPVYSRAALRLGDIEVQLGNYDEAAIWYEEAMMTAQSIDDWFGLAISLNGLGLVASNQNKPETALSYLREGLSYAKKTKNPNAISTLYISLGIAARASENYEEAERHFDEALELVKGRMFEMSEATILGNLGIMAYKEKDYNRALELSIKSIRLAHHIGHRVCVAEQLELLAKIKAEDGDPWLGAVYYGAANALRDTIGVVVPEREISEYEIGIDAIRASLSDEEIDEAWHDGQQMPLDTLISSLVRSK